MKTVLIRPSNPTGSGYLTEWGFLSTPLGLLQLAGCLLTMDDSEVKVIDMEADQMQVDRAVDEALDFNPDMVGVTIHASAAHRTSTRIAQSIKEQKKDTLLIAGGHHATFLPTELLRGGFDVVALGEAKAMTPYSMSGKRQRARCNSGTFAASYSRKITISSKRRGGR